MGNVGKQNEKITRKLKDAYFTRTPINLFGKKQITVSHKCEHVCGAMIHTFTFENRSTFQIAHPRFVSPI